MGLVLVSELTDKSGTENAAAWGKGGGLGKTVDDIQWGAGGCLYSLFMLHSIAFSAEVEMRIAAM